MQSFVLGKCGYVDVLCFEWQKLTNLGSTGTGNGMTAYDTDTEGIRQARKYSISNFQFVLIPQTSLLSVCSFFLFNLINSVCVLFKWTEVAEIV